MGDRKVVYTYIFGKYDFLHKPRVVTPGWDYICFTDDPELRSDIWQVHLSTRTSDERQLDDKKFAMKHKILFYRYLQGYQLSLAVDGRIVVNCNLDRFVNGYLRPRDDMVMARHPTRNCLYLEGEECKRLGLDDPACIDQQLSRYRMEGFPAGNGLHATGLIVRRHGRKSVEDLCTVWFKELEGGSRRDQLCFDYALWKSDPVQMASFDYRQNYRRKKDFILTKHRKQSPLRR